MRLQRFGIAVAIAMLASHASGAEPAPSFEVAYRAWDIVTELSRANHDSAISGECGKTFRPFVIPGLRMQSRKDQDVSAAVCVAAAKAACANGNLRKPADLPRRCEEFRQP